MFNKSLQTAVKKVVTKKPRGRPSKYRSEFDDLVYKFCLMGATDEQLAGFFEVNIDTIYEWRKVYPKFSEATRRGREIADAEIAASLYHRAKGYSHAENDIRTLSTGGGMSQIVITPTIKHYPPDTAAASLWLRNRQSGKWRDKIESEVYGKNGGAIDMNVRVSFV